MKRFVVLLVLLLLICHQDGWWWDSIDPLAFGFMPIGLTYHVLFSIVSAVVGVLAVRYCWPSDVDIAEHETIAAPRRQKGEL